MNARDNPALEGPGPVVKSVLRPDGLLWLPKIGDKYEDGLFAGIVSGEKVGDPDAMLIDLGFIDTSVNWQRGEVLVAARGAMQPSREEGLILRANLDSRSKESRGYFWLRTQCAGDDGCAWCQGFYDGGQDYDPKTGELLVRAVRRVPIQ